MPPLTRKEWLQLRKRGLGGSDAAAALGLSRWKSPLELWAEKTGAIPDSEVDEDDTPEAIDWGNILEPVIATQYSKRTCRKTEEIEPGARYTQPIQSPSLPFAFVDLDRRQWPAAFSADAQAIDERIRLACERDAALLGSNPTEGFLEIKNTGMFRREEWTDEPPLEVQVQVQHAFMVTGAGWASIAVLIGGNRLLWMDVKPNPSFIEQMAKREEEFWHLVETKTPPVVTHASDKDVLATLYKPEAGKSIMLPWEAAEIDTLLQTLYRQRKSIQEEEKILQARIQMMLGDAVVGTLPTGVGRYDWSPRHTDEFVMPAKDYRALNRYPRFRREEER